MQKAAVMISQVTICKSIFAAWAFSWLGALPSTAAVTYTFRQDGPDIVASYSGSLQTTLLSFQGGLTYSGRFVDIFGFVQDGETVIEFQNAQPLDIGQHPQHQGTSFRYSADNISYDLQMNFRERSFQAPNSTGDTFGFYIFSRSTGLAALVNVPFQYVSGTPIEGEMRFEGETLDSMGLEVSETFKVFLPGGEFIAGQVVPEPTAVSFAGLALIGSALRRRPHLSPA